MYKRKTIFIGCGDGRELLPLVHDRDHLLIGLEPIDQLFARAQDTLKGFPNVRLLHCRIQGFKAAEYLGDIDEIYAVFPTPEVLRREAQAIISQVYAFLAKERGRFRLYTEVTLFKWPDPEDRERLKSFLQVLEAEEFSVSRTEIGFAELPPMARKSDCGLKFTAHGISTFTAIEAKKLS